MRALCLDGPRQMCVREVSEPTPADGEVLVRIRACGVCASDLNAWRGVPGIEYPLPPGAPGHETWGEVADLGANVTELQVGQTVTGLLWNGLAELGVTRADHLVAVPGDLPLLGEPLACAANVVGRAAIAPGQRLALVGFGYLAALVVQLLPDDVGGWVAIARRDDSRALARQLGAEAVHDFGDIPGGLWDTFPVVIEAAGVQHTLDYASWLVAYGGRLVIAGYHADGPRTVNMQTWNWKGIDVVNAHERQPSAYVDGLRAGLDLATRRRLDLARLISHRWPLERAADAFEAAESRPPGFVKAIVVP
jgi:threonine dehydrogenase-like Zn-dependent dehydrogenase